MLNNQVYDFDEVNLMLREPVEVVEPRNRILVGSGEDCQYVMFGQNYKRVTEDDFEEN